MECPAIWSSRACRAPVVARAGFVRRQGTAADPGIPRADDRRPHTAASIAAHAFQRERLASCSCGHIEIIDVDVPAEDLVRVLPGDPAR
jgi:hypothetical protein